MVRHHRLGLSGGTGGVDQAGQVEVDIVDARPHGGKGFLNRLKAENTRPRAGVRGAAASQDREGEILVLPAELLERALRGHLGTRDQGRRLAVPENIGELVELGCMVDDDKNGARLERGVDPDHRFDAGAQEDRHPVAALDAIGD